MTSTAYDAALTYREWAYVIPLIPREKRPSISAWPDNASDEPAVIERWYTERPDGGVGLLMGLTPDSQFLFCLDVDEHDPTQSGSVSLAALEAEHGDLPPTVETETPNHGRHIFFHASQPISKSAGRLGPGIDVQGSGSFVVAPPSVHPNGGTYRFRDGHSFDEHPIATAPQWLIDRLTRPESTVTPPAARDVDEFWKSSDDSPADRYNASTTWNALLTEAGFTFVRRDRNGEEHWCRPGKDPADGTSVTVGYKGLDIAHVFTSAVPWLPPTTYSKFAFAACWYHHGDMSAMARTVIDSEKPSTIPTVTDPHRDDWGEPDALVADVELPPFPFHCLPGWIQDQALTVAEDLQVDIALTACLAIGACSAATLAHLNVTLEQQNWTQPANTYICIVMDPSAGKSPAKAAMFKAVEEIETVRMTMARSAVMRQDSLQKVLDKKMKGVQDRLAKSSGADYDAATADLHDLIDEMASLEDAPNGRMLIDDCTPEALAIAMKEAGGAIAQVSAEGGLFNTLAGHYSDGNANLDLYLEAWGGSRFQQDRVTRDPIVIPRANLTVTVTLQPSVMDDIGANQAMVTRGFEARFLITRPPNNVGYRDRRKTSRANPTITRTYSSHLRDMADRSKHRPIHLTVGPEAAARFADWDQAHEDELRAGGRYEYLSMEIGKLRANILRIAALLHVAHAYDKDTDIIGDGVMADAIAIGDYFLQHRVGLHARWGTDDVALQAQAILEWAVRNGRTGFTRRELKHGLRRRFPTNDSTVEPLRRLIECGWLRATGDLSGLRAASQGTPSLTLTMHPSAQEYLEQHKHKPSVVSVVAVVHRDVFSHTSLSQTEELSAPRPPDTTTTTATTDPISRSGLFDPEP